MIGSLLSLVVMIGVIALLGWRVFGGRGGSVRGSGIRRFFQYGTQYLLLVISAIGLTGLLGRALGRSTTIANGESDLALDIAFSVVGVPLFIAIAAWTRRTMDRDANEVRSAAWAASSAITTLTALGVTMYAAFNIGSWLVGIQAYDGYDLAQFLVWGVVLISAWTFDRAYTPVMNARPHLFLGSALGLIVTAIAVANSLTAAAEILLETSGQTLYSNSMDPLWRGLILAAIGIPVWVLYWFENARETKRDGLWYGYVLLLGTAGGLIASITAASTVVYRGFVWLIGDPSTTSAAQHFRDVPSAASVAIVGAAVWWYHQDQLVTPGPRTEVDRVFDYLMSGIGLLASGAGLGLLVVATIEGLTSATVLTSGSVMNALLLAATLLLVGSPVWAVYWQRITMHADGNPDVELPAPTRRAYLFLLFGIGGVAAIVSLVSSVYIFADDLLDTGLATSTFYRMRYALAALVATGGIAGYHWMIYDRERDAMRAKQHGPHYVLLVGPKDEALEHAIAHTTGGRVHTWEPTNGFAGVWNTSAVMQEIEASDDETMILFAEGTRLLAVPVQRD